MGFIQEMDSVHNQRMNITLQIIVKKVKSVALVDGMFLFTTLMELIIKLDVRQMIFVMIPNVTNVLPFIVLLIAYPKQENIFAQQETMLMAVRWVLAAVLTVQEKKRVQLYVAHVVIGKEDTHCVPMVKIRMAVVWGIIVHSHVIVFRKIRCTKERHLEEKLRISVVHMNAKENAKTTTIVNFSHGIPEPALETGIKRTQTLAG